MYTRPSLKKLKPGWAGSSPVGRLLNCRTERVESKALGCSEMLPTGQVAGLLRRVAPAVVALCFLSAVADARTIYVNKSATGANIGTSWANAYTVLTRAIAEAISGDQVWVAAGTYRPNDVSPTNFSRAQAFQLKKGVSIIGGFSGTETTLGGRSLAVSPVILSGDLKGNDSAANVFGQLSSAATTSDNAYNVFYHPYSLALDSTAVLDSVTVRGGNAYNGAAFGGAMYNQNCSPTIRNCTFTDNFAVATGGAIYSTGTSPTITNCTIAYNSTGKGGFVISNGAPSPTLTNCTIANNSAGGCYVSSGTGTLTNCIVWGNTSPQLSGPIFSASNCVIQNGYPGTHIITANPLLSPLGNYGGPTPTMSISGSSSATNGGLSSANLPTTDQRGLSRVPTPDIGAYDFQPNGYISPVQFKTGYQPCMVGSTPSLSFSTEGFTIFTIQWYQGTTGITTNPIVDGTTQTLTVPPLTQTTSFWARVISNKGTFSATSLGVNVVPASVVYVSTTGNDDINDGSSWARAKRSLTWAIALTTASNAYPGTQIWVATGTYRPNDHTPSNLDRSQAFNLKNGVAVIGGFAGTETSAAQRDAVSNPVILSGDLLGNDSATNVFGQQSSSATTSDNVYSVISNTGSPALDSTAVLDSVTIRGGNGSSGSAVHNVGNSPTLINCVLTDNYASSVGAVYNYNCWPILTNCTLAYNFAGSTGSALYNYLSSPVIANCTFACNSTNSGFAIDNEWSSPSFTNCTIANNTCAPGYSGGAISMYSGTATLTNCILWGNSPSAQISGGLVVASNCVIQAGYSGTKIVTSDPLLSPLGNYTGPTPTMAISGTSPAINGGVASVSTPTADQRGLPRDSTPDIGAFEYQSQGYAGPVQFKDGHQPCMVGSTPSLSFYEEGLTSGSIQWFKGATGELSNPVTGGTTQILTVPPLTQTTSFWAQVKSSTLTLNASSLAVQVVPATLVYVSTTGNDANDGSSWANAKRSLTGAIAAAPPSTAYPGTQVWVATGTYRPNDAAPYYLDRRQAFQLKNGVSVYGGFAGTESALTQRSVGGNPVILSGDLLGNDSPNSTLGAANPVTTTDNAYHVLNHPSWLGLNSTARLDSVMICGGNANGIEATSYYGGAIYNDTCSPTITNCTIAFNSSSSSPYGGAIFNSSSSPTFANCTIAYNTGGAIVDGPYPGASISQTFTNCTIAYNSAPIGSILNSSSFFNAQTTFQNCILIGNAVLDSVPLFWGSETPVLDHCVIPGGYTGFPTSGTANIVSDPLLSPLGQYGGPTPTMPISHSSPSINAGRGMAMTPLTDQRGFARDSQPDIGACEYQTVPQLVVLSTASGGTQYVLGTAPRLLAQCEGFSLTFQWFKGNPGDESTPVGFGGTSAWTLAPLTTGGTYWVKASSSAGTVFSNAITITLAPQRIFLSPTGNDSSDGSSWAAAKRTLQSAIAAAGYGSGVWMASGTYRPNDATPSNLDRTQSFQLKNGVRIYGGFAGTETSLAERTTSNPVILSGDLFGNDSAASTFGQQSSPLTTSENAYHVFYHPASLRLDSSAFLDSVTIRGGNGDSGSAIYNDTSSPTLANCTLTDNNATNSGGAIYNSTSSPTLTNCTIANNSGSFGGAIYNSVSSPTLTNCTIANNTADSIGGAIYNDPYGAALLTNCILWGNKGGGQIGGASSVASNCIIQGGYPGTAIVSADPLLLPMGSYGGQTPTIPCSAGSPAINMGGVSANTPATDQRGFLRDSQPDIGACEQSPASLGVVGVTQEQTTVYASGFHPKLVGLSEGANLSYQWFSGVSGDESSPLVGGIAASLSLPALVANASYWLKVSYSGTSRNSDTLSLTVTPPAIHLSTTGTDSNDGATWTMSKRTLQEAIAAAGYGGQVWIASGTYRPNDSDSSITDRNQAFQLKNGVAIFGGFAGTENSLSERTDGNFTLLSGDLLGNDSAANAFGQQSSPSSTSDNAYHVFNHPSSLALDSSAILDSVTVRGGSGSSGGAVFDSSCSPTFNNCTLTDNSASGYGGAIYNYFASPAFRNCTIAYNSAYNGGAVYNSSGTPAMISCTIVNNATSSTFSSGAIYNYAPGAVLNSCILWGNTGTAEVAGTVLSASTCIIQGGYSGTAILTSNPLLSPLANYGGPTPTMPALVTSPATNAGVASLLTPAFDQRGIPRDVQPDIGACEYPVYLSTDLIGTSASIGAHVTLTASTILIPSSYQWFLGTVGDTSSPISGAASASYITPPLEIGSDFWVAITSGSTTINSPTRSIRVRGTFQQWAALHGLSGGDADPLAAPANDGVCNLVKYATGLPLQAPASQSTYLATSVNGTTGTLNLDLTLSSSPTDVTWSFLQSSDLVSWTAATGTVTQTHSSTGLQLWRLSVPAIPGNRFFKVQFQK